MNFLAHIYLSGTHDLLKLGNFVADGIRGKNYLDYPSEMQAGIILHRKIDSYTDSHPTFRQSTKRLHKNYSHYSGVIVDIYYDHFLAKNWKQYCEEDLDSYVQSFYKLVTKNFDLMPPKFQKLTPYMIEQNWLLSYADIDGITKVLSGLDRRTNLTSKMSYATEDLIQNYDAFEHEFTRFFTDLIAYSKNELELLKTDYLL